MSAFIQSASGSLNHDPQQYVCWAMNSDFLLLLFRLHPTYVHAMNNLGNIMKERNELIEAEQLLTTAVAIQ